MKYFNLQALIELFSLSRVPAARPERVGKHTPHGAGKHNFGSHGARCGENPAGSKLSRKVSRDSRFKHMWS